MSPKNAADTRPSPQKMSYEQAIEELESIIERIEQGQVGLQESLTEYRRGVALLKRCRGILDVAEQQVQRMTAQDAAGDSSEAQQTQPV